jgi:hypothetical protein
MMAAAMVAMVYSRHYLLQHALLKGEYFVLVMLSILGMMVMVSGKRMPKNDCLWLSNEVKRQYTCDEQT